MRYPFDMGRDSPLMGLQIRDIEDLQYVVVELLDYWGRRNKDYRLAFESAMRWHRPRIETFLRENVVVVG